MILCARAQSAAFYSVQSGQSPLVLNHIESHYKDKVGSVPRRRLRGSDLALGIDSGGLQRSEAIRNPALNRILGSSWIRSVPLQETTRLCWQPNHPIRGGR